MILGNPSSAWHAALLPARFSHVENHTASTAAQATTNKAVVKYRHFVAFVEYYARERQ
jgi:hypothetical protein